MVVVFSGELMELKYFFYKHPLIYVFHDKVDKVDHFDDRVDKDDDKVDKFDNVHDKVDNVGVEVYL